MTEILRSTGPGKAEKPKRFVIESGTKEQIQKKLDEEGYKPILMSSCEKSLNGGAWITVIFERMS